MRAHHRKLRHQAFRTAGSDDDSVVDNNFTGGSSSVNVSLKVTRTWHLSGRNQAPKVLSCFLLSECKPPQALLVRFKF